MAYRIVFTRRIAVGLCFVLPWLAGCAAFHPMTGVPVRYVPDDLKVARRNGQRTIDISLLTRRWNGVHLVDSGDVLGIYIAGVLGKIDENPQVQFPQNADYKPAAGVPVTVDEDGTISLPWINQLKVRGLTIRQTQDAIRKAYTNHPGKHEFLKPGSERILVSLQRPRQIQVLVVRQDSRAEPLANAAVGLLNIGTAKRGSGKVVSLPAYRNDVLNALIATDGLPGLDATSEVYIIRSQRGRGPDDPVNFTDAETLIRQMKKADEPVIRGQSQDGFDNRFVVQPEGNYPDPNSDYRRAPLGTFPQNMSERMPGRDWGRPPQNRDLSQRNDQTQDGEIRNQFQGQQNSGNAHSTSRKPTGIDATSYQNLPDNQNQSNSGTQLRNPYAPTPLSGTNQQPQFPPQTPPPFSDTPPSARFPVPVQPNLPPSQPLRNPPPSGGMIPGQGYSITDAVPTGIDPQIPIDPQISGPDYAAGSDQDPARRPRIVRIPLRLAPDEHVDISDEDVTLNDGDIVFIESRDTEVFFTGGLLGGGQFTLPRDFDLTILEALSIATSRQGGTAAARQIGGVSALNSDVTISPSNVVIIRKLPEGGEIPIKVNLYQARTDLSERIFIQPGDYIYLQYTPWEAVGAFIERHLLEGALFSVFTQNAKL